MSLKISVVLAAKNEADNLKILVPALLKSYNKEILEVIVVNDNSTDDTREVVRNLIKKNKKIKLINRSPPNGVGRTIKEGFRNVDKKATHVLTMDSDFIRNVPEVRRLINQAEQGWDVVVGSRYIPGGVLKNYPPLKKFANRGYHFLVWHILNIKHHDLTNNFKLMRKEVVESIRWESEHFAINAETGLFPYVKKYKIKEVPVSWIERAHGASDFKVIKLGPSYLKVFWRVLIKRV